MSISTFICGFYPCEVWTQMFVNAPKSKDYICSIFHTSKSWGSTVLKLRPNQQQRVSIWYTGVYVCFTEIWSCPILFQVLRPNARRVHPRVRLHQLDKGDNQQPATQIVRSLKRTRRLFYIYFLHHVICFVFDRFYASAISLKYIFGGVYLYSGFSGFTLVSSI